MHVPCMCMCMCMCICRCMCMCIVDTHVVVCSNAVLPWTSRFNAHLQRAKLFLAHLLPSDKALAQPSDCWKGEFLCIFFSPYESFLSMTYWHQVFSHLQFCEFCYVEFKMRSLKWTIYTRQNFLCIFDLLAFLNDRFTWDKISVYVSMCVFKMSNLREKRFLLHLWSVC